MSTYYFLPTRNVFGEGAVNEAGALLGSLHVSHAMIVTDKFLAQSGMADRVSQILADSGIQSVIFDGAEPNPTDKKDVYKRQAFYIFFLPGLYRWLCYDTLNSVIRRGRNPPPAKAWASA